jgi:PAS domain S-box-containing protein
MNAHSTEATIMVLDDEPAVQDALRLRLERMGYNVLTASSHEEFIETMIDCDAVLCDIILPGDNGLQALKWSHQHYPNTPVIMMTGEPTFETAAEAIRLGAYDYLAKPVNKEALLATLDRAVQFRLLRVEKDRLEAENEAYRLELEQRVAEQTRILRESQEFLTTLTDTMADVVFSLKMPGYRIEYANRAVSQIFGYQPEELLGQPIRILYSSESSFDTFDQKRATAVAMDQPQMRLEQPMLKKDGKSIWTEMVTTFIYAAGQLSQIICVVRDITQRTFLLGVVAHELRSPLGLLTGFSQAMASDIESLDQESIAKYLQVINESATRMLKMVDELLDMTKIELGEVSLHLESVDLAELLKTQKNAYTYVARKKNVTLKDSLFSEPLTCRCDPIKIGQVVSNFIDNAIKYSDPATTIEIVGKRESANIWVGVKDEGPGIKSDEIQHLFKSFGHTKISSKPTAGEKSSGLGLAISSKIIEAHHGEIGVDSTVGQGSTFWFTLPVATVAEKQNDKG